MRRSTARLLGWFFLAGCVSAMNPGCSFHRTDQGFAIRSNWSLECNRKPWLALRLGNSTEPDNRYASAPMEKEAQDPELLPWRSRLKGYRLGARLFRNRKPSETLKHADVEIAGEPDMPTAPIEDKKGLQAASSSIQTSPLSEGEETTIQQTSATKDMQLPESVRLLSEPQRPDVFVD